MLAILYGIGREFDWVLPVEGSVATSFAFLSVSYVLGHLILHFARTNAKSNKKKESPLSNEFLNEDHPEFHPMFKAQLRTAIEKEFKVVLPQKKGDADSATINQAVFDLCYAYVIQRGKGFYTENFNALYGMCRSMKYVVYFGIVYAWIIVFTRGTLSVSLDIFSLVLSTNLVLLIVIFGLYLGEIFEKANIAYAKLFVLSVYRAFYCLKIGPEKDGK